jgi:hypothetical protein
MSQQINVLFLDKGIDFNAIQELVVHYAATAHEG